MYGSYINELMKVCKLKRLQLKQIGCFDKIWPIFSIEISGKKPKKTICFSAGIHGTEIAGPYAILEFLKHLNKKNINHLKLILLPCNNPSGFNKIYKNYLKIDPNVHFHDKRPKNETKILIDYIKNKDIFFFHALHEDGAEYRFYTYNFEKRKEPIYRDIINIAKRHFKINKDEMIYRDWAKQGLVTNRKDGSFEDWMFRNGTAYSMATETPGQKPLKERVELNIEIMNKVISFVSGCK